MVTFFFPFYKNGAFSQTMLKSYISTRIFEDHPPPWLFPCADIISHKDRYVVHKTWALESHESVSLVPYFWSTVFNLSICKAFTLPLPLLGWWGGCPESSKRSICGVSAIWTISPTSEKNMTFLIRRRRCICCHIESDAIVFCVKLEKCALYLYFIFCILYFVFCVLYFGFLCFVFCVKLE